MPRARIARGQPFEDTRHREPSEEIRRSVHRWMAANSEGDADSVLAKVSGHAGMLAIGTDGPEWWHGREIAVWRRQLEKMGDGVPITWDEIESWEEGTVGWAGMKMTFHGADGAFDARSTFVLHLEHGEWKIVQVHSSLEAEANVQILGRELTLSLEQTIQREQPDMSSTLAADGTVTIVFTDIVDSTLLISRLGDRAWLDVLRRHNVVIEQATT
jgi:hypothetical protein